LTGQSHFMLIFVLRKATLPNRINSVPWMNAVTPTPYHECTQLVWIKVALRSRQTACIHGTELVWPRSFMVRSWCDRGHSWYGVDVTAVIHGTELMWPRAFMVRSWCDSAKSFHVVPVYTVQWQFIWRIFSFLSFINDEKIHQISYIRTQPSTLRSWCNLVKWPYGVKKISIKWLLPVKVTLEVIKRHPKVFCWSCDEDPLKWDKKICRASSLLLRIEWAYSHLSVRMVGQYL
jgi:hypothetical protein